MDVKTKDGKSLLNINDLDGVVGGADTGNKKNGNNVTETVELFCNDPRCRTTRIFYKGSGGRAVCSCCHTQILY